jgi:hypothetical protein
VVEDAVDDVGDGLEPAVWMPGGAFGFAGGVVHFAHLVHVHEWVELAHAGPGERAPDREALAL